MLTLKVTHATGTHELTTRPWTICQWENKHKTKISKVSTDGIGMADMLWLAWRQLHDDGLIDGNFEDWARTVHEVEPIDTDTENPTKPAPSAG